MQKLIILLFIFSASIGFSQENNCAFYPSKIPVSIYNPTHILPDLNSASIINNRLNLKSYNFIVFDKKSIEDGYYSIPLFNNKTPTSFIYETYTQIHQNSYLKKSFFKVSDLYLVRAKNPL
jgi:hypothetical protein